MPAPPAAAIAGPSASPPARRLVLLPRESRGEATAEAGPRHYRLARLEPTQAARAERFAHLKRSYD